VDYTAARAVARRRRLGGGDAPWPRASARGGARGARAATVEARRARWCRDGQGGGTAAGSGGWPALEEARAAGRARGRAAASSGALMRGRAGRARPGGARARAAGRAQGGAARLFIDGRGRGRGRPTAQTAGLARRREHAEEGAKGRPGSGRPAEERARRAGRRAGRRAIYRRPRRGGRRGQRGGARGRPGACGRPRARVDKCGAGCCRAASAGGRAARPGRRGRARQNRARGGGRSQWARRVVNSARMMGGAAEWAVWCAKGGSRVRVWWPRRTREVVGKRKQHVVRLTDQSQKCLTVGCRLTLR
jgi:hypothetical protein